MFGHSSSKPKQPMFKNSSDKKELESSLTGSLSSLAKGTANESVKGVTDMGKGIFDQLLGITPPESQQKSSPEQQSQQKNEQGPRPVMRKETLFDFTKNEEDRKIEELTQQIRQQIEYFKQANQALMSEVKDVEKITLHRSRERKGIGEVGFLEMILKLMKTLSLKANESKMWMQAVKTRKASRGSLFAKRSKDMGTAYSESQEHTAQTKGQ